MKKGQIKRITVMIIILLVLIVLTFGYGSNLIKTGDSSVSAIDKTRDDLFNEDDATIPKLIFEEEIKPEMKLFYETFVATIPRAAGKTDCFLEIPNFVYSSEFIEQINSEYDLIIKKLGDITTTELNSQNDQRQGLSLVGGSIREFSNIELGYLQPASLKEFSNKYFVSKGSVEGKPEAHITLETPGIITNTGRIRSSPHNDNKLVLYVTDSGMLSFVPWDRAVSFKGVRNLLGLKPKCTSVDDGMIPNRCLNLIVENLDKKQDKDSELKKKPSRC
jgi:hypothetical protein